MDTFSKYQILFFRINVLNCIINNNLISYFNIKIHFHCNNAKTMPNLYYNFSKTRVNEILLLLETYQRPIRDVSETHWSQTFLIGSPSETNMHDRRSTCLIGDIHASSETNMPDRIPTCLIGYQHVWSETLRRSTCFIKHGLMTHVGFSWVSDQACMSSIGLDQVCWSSLGRVGLQLVSDGSSIF